MPSLRSIVAAGVALGAWAGLSAAQSSVLYFSQFGNGVPGHFDIVQNGALLSTADWVGGIRQYGIAVADDIRTVDYIGSQNGGRYDLAGNFLGTPYKSGLATNFVDGTTDGTTANWVGNYFGREVYRFDRDWAGGTVAFMADSNIEGITYDSGNGTLWVAAANSGRVAQYKTDGTFVSAFPIDSARCLLAYEPSTGTIWTKEHFHNIIRQYDRSGSLLASIDLPFLQQGAFGMEFAIPGPGVGVLGVGGLILSRRRRA